MRCRFGHNHRDVARDRGKFFQLAKFLRSFLRCCDQIEIQLGDKNRMFRAERTRVPHCQLSDASNALFSGRNFGRQCEIEMSGAQKGKSLATDARDRSLYVEEIELPFRITPPMRRAIGPSCEKQSEVAFLISVCRLKNATEFEKPDAFRAGAKIAGRHH